ncbi:hypothetical protein EJ08DRAFT_411300 [Tothia fuscella]|uniref:Uncharacterized protein n=1 Tax=Tothia fuscella TaxID=1048955 RepID=A0A9P4NKL2_9PEZI|nr:hypothetical protein EJ08DRAFT_411300 [Tothia fuscella]
MTVSQMPNEVKCLIADKCDDLHTLLNLRLVDHEFCESSWDAFGLLFHTLTVHIHPQSINRLHEIALHPRLSKAVQHFAITTRLFLLEADAFKASRRDWARGVSRYSGQDVKQQILPDSVYGRVSTYYNEQETLWTRADRHSAHGARFSFIPQRLARTLSLLQNCLSVSLNELEGTFPGNGQNTRQSITKSTLLEDGGYNAERYHSHLLDIVLRIIDHANKAVTTFKIDMPVCGTPMLRAMSSDFAQ